MTRKLYEQDSHLRAFRARVLACRPEGAAWAVLPDRTAFFPGGGGQAADEGRLGGLPLLGLREAGAELWHLLPAPLEAGAEVEGVLDWDLRFGRMQGHSGEHIVSGTVHRLFGFENVGFHMGGAAMTLDFSGELGPEDLRAVEREANRAVWADLPVRAFVPSPAELARLAYRSKKALEGPVRLVEIPGVDLCACCAPHVARTGEIGPIKITDAMRHRGGTRLTLLCGAAALADYAALHEDAAGVSAALSAPRLEGAAAVRRLLRAQEALHAELGALRRALVRYKAAALPETAGALCLFEPGLDAVSLRELVNAGMEKAALCAAFTGGDGDYRYVVGSLRHDLRALAPALHAAIQGKGGGSPTMLQGTARAARADIEAYFARLVL